MNRLSISSMLLIAACVISAIYSVGLKAHLLNREDAGATLRRGEAAPGFELSRLDGTRMELGQVAGENRVVLVNFWATWCQPCRIEMPQLEKIYAEYHPRGLEILAISGEDEETIAAFLEGKGYSYPILVDPGGAVGQLYGVEAIPTTVLLDSQGHITRVQIGLNPILEREIERLMAEGAQR
jgi:peroxiredoxin